MIRLSFPRSNRRGGPWVLLLFLFLFSACEEEPIEATLGQRPPGSRFQVDTIDTFTTRFLQLRTPRQEISSSLTNSAGVLNYSLRSTKVGAYRSPLIGLNEYVLMVQPQDGNAQFSLPENTSRAELVLPLVEGDTSRWGRPGDAQTWTIRPLTRFLEGPYVTDTLFGLSPSEQDQFFADAVIGRYEGPLQGDALRIPLTQAGLDTFRALAGRIFNTGQLVTEQFPGMMVRLEGAAELAEDAGAVGEFSLQDEAAGLFFYSNENGRDSVVAQLPFGDNTPRRIFSRQILDNTPAGATLREQRLNGNQAFLSPIPGLRLNVDFPGLRRLASQDTLLVHAAELFVPIDTEATPAIDLPSLLVFSSGADSSRSNIVGYLPVLSVAYSTEQGGYRVPMTQQVQDLLEPNPNPAERAAQSFNLELSKGALFPVYLDLRNKASEGGVELRVVYSKLSR